MCSCYIHFINEKVFKKLRDFQCEQEKMRKEHLQSFNFNAFKDFFSLSTLVVWNIQKENEKVRNEKGHKKFRVSYLIWKVFIISKLGCHFGLQNKLKWFFFVAIGKLVLEIVMKCSQNGVLKILIAFLWKIEFLGFLGYFMGQYQAIPKFFQLSIQISRKMPKFSNLVP